MGRKRTGNPPGRRRKYPREAIVELYASGLSATEVGRHLGIHHTTVLYSLNLAGVERRKKVDPNSARMAAKRMARDARDGLIARLYLEEKLSTPKIAERMGISRSVVWDALKRLKVKTRGRGTEPGKPYQHHMTIAKARRDYLAASRLKESERIERMMSLSLRTVRRPTSLCA